jgi:hypothetical protein
MNFERILRSLIQWLVIITMLAMITGFALKITGVI